MPGRKSLIDTLWLLSSLALLAWVLAAPMVRKSGLVAVSSRPDCRRNDFALPPAEPRVHLRAGMAADADLEGDALAWEEEEQDRVDASERSSRVLPRHLCVPQGSHSPVGLPPPILSRYPIRC
jgi:hypothetical protein